LNKFFRRWRQLADLPILLRKKRIGKEVRLGTDVTIFENIFAKKNAKMAVFVSKQS
jgi:hypothetical protein